MKEIKKLLRLNRQEYYETHLSLLNCILPKKMTPTEMKVVAAFMSLEGDIAQYRFGPSAKKIVMSNLKLSPAGLSNYITSLKNNGFLIEKGDLTEILPILTPENGEQMYMFKLVNSEADA